MKYILILSFVWYVSSLTCQDPPLSSYLYCNSSAPAFERAKDLASRMKLDEKISQMGNEASAIPELGVPAYNWWSEALHGVLTDCGTNCPTSFPAASCSSASFNRTLWHKIGIAISDEARALNNEGITGLDFWAPNININRDPRWGRNQECPGEDPFLTGQYAINYIKGMQEGPDTRYIKVGATPKHFTANTLENWGGWDRYSISANVTNQDLVETYLGAWEYAIKIGRPRSLMCSYNAVNMVPSCANTFLMETIVREHWGWEGYVVSDCDAISCIINNHHYTNNSDDTCYVALNAGCDNDCGDYYPKNLPHALQTGKVPQQLLDKSLIRTLAFRFETGQFDPADIQPYRHIPPQAVDSPEHKLLAFDAAAQSIVLLQNPNNILPLPSGKKIAVIGPHANATEALLSNYHGQRCHDKTFNCVNSPFLAIQEFNKGGQTTLTKGCDINSQNTSQIAAAVSAAQAADYVVLAIGIDGSVENEGLDRYDIGLPGVQPQLAQAILKLNKPTVVVLINGGQVDVGFVKTTQAALLACGYGGQSGGDAIAHVLFGVVNPGGKLPVTIYPSAFTSETRLDNFNMPPGTANPGRTYKYYTGTPVWEFGFGLSYTTFQLTWKSEPQNIEMSVESPKTIYYEVEVTNTGKVGGSETVLAFFTPPDSQVKKQLFDFQKVYLNPGESQSIFFTMQDPLTTLSQVTENGDKVVKPGIYRIIFSRGHGEPLTHYITMNGLPKPVVLWPRQPKH